MSEAERSKNYRLRQKCLRDKAKREAKEAAEARAKEQDKLMKRLLSPNYPIGKCGLPGPALISERGNPECEGSNSTYFWFESLDAENSRRHRSAPRELTRKNTNNVACYIELQPDGVTYLLPSWDGLLMRYEFRREVRAYLAAAEEKR